MNVADVVARHWVRTATATALSIVLAGTAWADSSLQNAQGFYSKGELRSAVIELKNVLQDNPSDAQARNLLGRIYLQQGNGPAAEKELRRARALGLDSQELQLDLAEAYLKQQQFDRVLSEVDPGSIEDQSLRARAWALQGMAAVGKRDPVKGREYLERSVELAPDLASAVLGLVALDVAEKHSDKAGARIDRLLAVSPDNTNALLVKAELSRQDKRFDDALALYTRAIEINAKEPRFFLGRATSYLSQQKVDPALKDLDRVDELQPGLVMTSYLRGLAAFQQQDLDTARDHLQRVMGVLPNHKPTELLYGIVSYLKNDYQIADELLGRFLTAAPGHVPAAKVLAAARLKLKKPDGAIDVLQPLVTPNQRDAQLYALLGSAYMMRGDHAKGAEYMQKAVEIQPDLAALRTQLAMGLLKGGNMDQAVSQLQSAVELDQDLIQADVLLVMAHLRKQDYEQALKVSKALEKRMPDSPIPFNLTGLAYLAKQDMQLARQSMERALQVDPQFVTAEFNLVRIEMSEANYDAAQKRYQHILEVQPANPKAMIGLAALAEKRKDPEAMLKWLQMAVEKNPDSIEAASLLGRYYLSTGKPLKALSLASGLSSRFPSDVRVLDLLGKAQLATGEASSAVRSFERLAELSPSPEMFLQLAGAQLKAKDRSGARISVKEALKLDRKHLQAQLVLGVFSLEDENFKEALNIARKVQQDHADVAGGFELEGRIRFKQGEIKLALDAYEQAYKITKNGKIALQLAETYKKAGRNDDAIRVMRDWLNAQPMDHNGRLVLAMLLQQLGRHQDAIKEYETLAEHKKTNAVTMNNLAWLYFVEGDRRALDLSKQAYEANSERAEIADTYGWILLQMGQDPELALSLLQQAYVSYPTNGEIGYHVGVALHKNGRDAEAKRTLKNALRDDSSFAEVEQARALLKQLGG